MSQRFTKILLALFATSMLFTACKKQSSPDDPLPPNYTPNIIISSNNEFVYAFDPVNGNKSWEYNVGSPVVSSPMLYNEMLYVATQNGTLHKLNAKTGVEVKTIGFTLGTPGFTATPVADANLIYLPSINDTIYVIDTGTFAVKWKYGIGGPITSSPVIFNGQVIFGGTDGKVYSIDKTAGTLTWSYNAGAGITFSSSPAASGPFIYIGGSDGKMYSLFAVAPTNAGLLRWTYQTQGPIESSPTAYGGNCIFGSDDLHVYCIDTTSGQYRWIDSTGDRVISSPFGYGETIYVGSFDLKLYAINILDGSYKWTFTTSGAIQSSPIGYGTNVYVGSDDFYLYALDTATGNLTWKQNINGLILCSPVIDNLSGSSFNSGISGFTN